MPTLTLAEANALVIRTLTRCRTDADNARSVASPSGRCVVMASAVTIPVRLRNGKLTASP